MLNFASLDLPPLLLASTVHPTRKTILETLKRRRYATASELAEHLELAPVSVRHHIDLLIGDGLIVAPRVRRTAGAGRPQQVYALTAEADAYFPNQYQQLAGHSLEALKQTLPPAQLQEALQYLAQRAADEMPISAGAPSPEAAAAAAANFLDERGYMVEIEKGPDTWVLHTCNCPYSALVSRHPELCALDLHFIAALIGQAPDRVAHMPAGDARCSYRFCWQNQPAQPAQPIAFPLPLLAETLTHA